MEIQDRNHMMPQRRLIKRVIQRKSLEEAIEKDGANDYLQTQKNVKNQNGLLKKLDGLITFSLVALFVGVPLFFTNLTLQGLAFEKQVYFYIWTLIILVAWVSKAVVMGEMHIRKTPFNVPLIIFLGIYILASVFSIDRWHSFWGFFNDPTTGLMNVAAMIITYFTIINNFTEKRFKLILISLIGVTSFISVWTTLGIMGILEMVLPSSIGRYVPLSFIGTLSDLSLFIAMMIPIIIIGIFKVNQEDGTAILYRKTLTIVMMTTLVLSMFLLLALFPFMKQIIPVVGFGILFFVVFILAKIVRPEGNWAFLPFIVLIFGALFIAIFGDRLTIARIALPLEVSPTFKTSLVIAQESIKNNFFIGTGPATYGYNFSKFQPDNFDYTIRFYQATGYIFEAISTIGALGTIMLIINVLTFAGIGIFLLSREKEKNKIYSLGFLTAAFIALLGVLFTRVEGAMAILTGLIAIVALGILFKESDAYKNYIHLSLKTSPKYALTLAFLFMIVSASVAFLFIYIGKAFTADIIAGSALREKQISENGSVKKMLTALTYHNQEGRYYTRIGQEYMILANAEALKPLEERKSDLALIYLKNAISSAQEGVRRMEKDVLSKETLAQIYENAAFYSNDPELFKSAENTYREALILEPHNPRFYTRIGILKNNLSLLEKDKEKKAKITDEAREMFDKAIKEQENYAPAYYQLSGMEETSKNLDNAIIHMQKAYGYDRQNINYYFNLGRLLQERGSDEDNRLAEVIFKQILGVNDKEVNTHFSLATLYEKTNKKQESIAEYQKVLSLLPEKENPKVRESITKLIENIQNGVSNFPTIEENAPEDISIESVKTEPVINENIPVTAPGVTQ